MTNCSSVLTNSNVDAHTRELKVKSQLISLHVTEVSSWYVEKRVEFSDIIRRAIVAHRTHTMVKMN